MRMLIAAVVALATATYSPLASAHVGAADGRAELSDHVTVLRTAEPVDVALPDNTVAMLQGLGVDVDDLLDLGVDEVGRAVLVGHNADGDVCLVLKDPTGPGASATCATVERFLDQGLTVYTGGPDTEPGAARLQPDGWEASGGWGTSTPNLLTGLATEPDLYSVRPDGQHVVHMPMPTREPHPSLDEASASPEPTGEPLPSSAATNVYYRVYEQGVVASGAGSAITSGTSTQNGGQSRTAMADSVVYGSVYAPGGYKIRDYGGDGHVVAYAISTNYAYTTCYHVNFSGSSRAMSCFYTRP